MPPPRSADPKPELSSISSALGDLTSRITALAEQYSDDKGSNVSQELYEVERSLNAGRRRLEGLLR